MTAAPIDLPADVMEQIHAHCEAVAPREACGIIAQTTGGGLEFAAFNNSHPEPETAFQIPPDEWHRLYVCGPATGRLPMAIIHSHVQPHSLKFSDADARAQRAIKLPWGLVRVLRRPGLVPGQVDYDARSRGMIWLS